MATQIEPMPLNGLTTPSGMPGAMPSAMPGAMPGIPLVAIVRLLRRRAWLVVLLGMAGAVAAYAYARTLPKSYTASTLLAVSGSSFAIPELQGALRPESMGDPLPVVRTEMQALTSRDLVLQVVQQLHLDQDPEFNSDLRPPSGLARLKARFQSLLPGATTDAGGQSDPLPGIVGAVTGGIRIFQDNRSLAIDVGFVSHDPQRSAQVANTLAADYMAIRARRQSSANTGASEEITRRIDEVRADIAALEAQIAALRASSETVAVRAGSVSQQQLEDLASAAAKAGVERAQLEASYARAQALSAQGMPADIAGVLGSATISQLRDREAAASQKMAALSSRYGPGYPGVQAATADLASARAQLAAETRRIVASMGAQVRVAAAHEAEIKAQLDDARRQAVASENGQAKLKQLQDEVTARQKLYQTMLERAQQTSGQPNEGRLPDVYVIATAAPPTGPSGPNMKMAAGFGGVGGGALGCALALLGLRTAPRPGKRVGSVGGIAVAGSLSGPVLRRIRAGTPSEVDLLAVCDSVQAVRGGGTRVVVVMDANGAGMALTVGWARAALERGDRVAVVDTGFTAPAALPPLPGPRDDLVASLSGQRWPDVLDEGSPFRFHGGAAPVARTADLLTGPVFANLVAHLRESADLVLLLVPGAGDGTPDAAAGTAAVLRQAEAGILVLGPGNPSRKAELAAACLTGGVHGPLRAVVAEG